MISKEKAYHIIRTYLANEPIKKIHIFGSFARGEQQDTSDIDLLLEMEHPVGLMTLSCYRLKLEELTGLKVDLGTTKGISEYVHPFIEKDFETVYEK